MKKTSGIYAITSPSGKQYIGQAQCIRTRWWEHRKYLRLGTHHCKGLQHAYAKYGEDALVFSIIAVVPLEELNAREQLELDARPKHRLYNTALFVRRPLQGLKHTEEARAKMADAARNRSAEVRQKLSAGRRGKLHTEEMKLTMSRRFTGEGHPKWGTKHSPETMAKLIAAQQNRSAEWRARISASKLGVKRSPETIAKMSAVAMGKRMGADNNRSRSVICIETGVRFDAIKCAERWLRENGHLKAAGSAITLACNGKLHHAYGLHWKYA